MVGYSAGPSPMDGPMTDAAAILEVRHVRLAEQATLRPASLGDGEEGVFVALDDPPPVRTVLAVVEGDRRRALEVAWVVEVAERDEMRGFYGRWLADEALGRAVKVGTEHLEDGTPVVQPVVYDHSSMIDVSDAPVMAMPAPVMIVDDDTGAGDEDEDDRGDEDPTVELLAHHAASSAERGHDVPEAGLPDEADAHDPDLYPDTLHYADYPHRSETAGASDQADADDASDSGERGEAAEADSAETSTDSGETPTESKSRKKRSRKRR